MFKEFDFFVINKEAMSNILKNIIFVNLINKANKIAKYL